MNRSEGKQLVEQKVEDFSNNKETYLNKSFNETEARDRFIDPLFRALGWEFDQTHLKRHLWDVHREYSQKEKSSTKKPDYAFRVDGKLKFFVEAKAPWVSLTDKKPVFQAKRYAFSTSGKAPIIVLTDFEEFRVFNAMARPVFDNPLQGLLKQFDLHYSNYSENWDLLYEHFSKESVSDGSLDGLRKKLSKNTKPLDEEFLRDITEWREKLARNIAIRNSKLSVEEINESVQRILDKLVFIRNLEDREIEPENLLLDIAEKKINVYTKLLPIFRRMNGEYNGLLFNKHFSEELIVDDKIIKTIIKKMCWPQSPFQFDVIEPEILGRIYEKFLGSKIRLTAGHHAKVEEKPEVRHAGGVYYTPQYIVDYIVKNTVGKKIEGKSPDEIQNIKIIDPACGSGSFLLGAFDLLMKYHRKWYGKNRNYRKFRNDYFKTQDGEIQLTLRKKADILKNNIFGVDIDREATEVAMMSQYLKLLGEGFDKGQALLFLSKGSLGKGHILPDLSGNIKCGNSLIGSDFYGKQNLSLFDHDELKRINVFDWQMEFPQIFDSSFEGGKENVGGFDCVIGNPPYISWYSRQAVSINKDEEHYLRTHYDFLKNETDKARIHSIMFFLEKSYSLLKEDGILSMIIDQNIHDYPFRPIRKYIAERAKIFELVNNITAFSKVSSGQSILTFVKIEPSSNDEIKLKNKGVKSSAEFYKQSLFLEPENSYRWNYSKHNEILKKVENGKTTFLENEVNIITGVAVNATKDGKKQFIFENKHGEFYFPLLEGGKSIDKPYCVFKYSRYLKYDKPLEIKLNDEFEKKYLKEKGSRQRPFNIRKKEEFDRPKILLRQSDVRLTATLVNEFVFGNYSLFTIFDNLDDEKKLKFLLGLLNSTILTFYAIQKNIILIRKGKTPQIRSGQRGPTGIRQLPIRTIDFSSQRDKTCHDKILELVNDMLASNKQLQKVKTEHDRNLIQRKIDILDKQIDRLVYELYDLTDEEIQIVRDQ